MITMLEAEFSSIEISFTTKLKSGGGREAGVMLARQMLRHEKPLLGDQNARGREK